MKITIVGGGGVVGSSTAFRIAQDGKVSEIVLVDIRSNLAEAHALDIGQAVVHRATTHVRAGKVGDTKNSDVIILTAGAPRHSFEHSRREYLSENLPLIMDTVGVLLVESPSAIWIVATLPVDPLVYLIRHVFSIPREKLIGLNRNDTSRFRWAIAKTLSIPSTAVEAFVLGEHGESQVPIFSRIRIHGETISLKPEQISQVRGEISSFYAQWNKLQPGRTAGWTTAESIGDIISSIVSEDGQIWACSTCLEGEYGLKEVSLGVPIRLISRRVKEIVKFDLDPAEQKALEKSAASIREMIKEGQALLKKTHKPQ
jgi:malate dehydrogenase